MVNFVDKHHTQRYSTVLDELGVRLSTDISHGAVNAYPQFDLNPWGSLGLTICNSIALSCFINPYVPSTAPPIATVTPQKKLKWFRGDNLVTYV
jgi:hypothetical protein